MSLIDPFVKFLVPIILIIISLKSEDISVAQITGLVGVTIFVISFFFSPLWLKLIISLIFAVIWLTMGDSLITFLYRKFRQ